VGCSAHPAQIAPTAIGSFGAKGSGFIRREKACVQPTNVSGFSKSSAISRDHYRKPISSRFANPRARARTFGRAHFSSSFEKESGYAGPAVR
jgi:hypothetical protein